MTQLEQGIPSSLIDSIAQTIQQAREQLRSAVRSELSWTHYRTLMRVDNTTARDWYLQKAVGCIRANDSPESVIFNVGWISSAHPPKYGIAHE